MSRSRLSRDRIIVCLLAVFLIGLWIWFAFFGSPAVGPDAPPRHPPAEVAGLEFRRPPLFGHIKERKLSTP